MRPFLDVASTAYDTSEAAALASVISTLSNGGEGSVRYTVNSPTSSPWHSRGEAMWLMIFHFSRCASTGFGLPEGSGLTEAKPRWYKPEARLEKPLHGNELSGSLVNPAIAP